MNDPVELVAIAIFNSLYGDVHKTKWEFMEGPVNISEELKERYRRMARGAIAALNEIPWTPDEVDSGARAAVEKIRLEQRGQNQKQFERMKPVSISNPEMIGQKNGQIIQPAYQKMSDDDWRKFRNLPICAAMLVNVNTVFSVLKRVGLTEGK